MPDHKLTERDFDVVARSELGREFIRPERILLDLKGSSRAKPIDIGSWCYTVRETRGTADTRQEIRPKRVDIASLLPSRRELVRSIADWIYVSGNRDETIHSTIRNIHFILDWADENNASNAFESAERARVAYAEFTDHLIYLMLVKERIGVNTASRHQKVFKLLAKIMFASEASYITASAQAIVEQKTALAAPSQADVSRFISFLVPFARSLRQAVMEQDFPFHVDCGGDAAMIVPTNAKPVFSPYASIYGGYYDTENYRAYSYTEHLDYCEKAGKKPESQSHYSRFEGNLESANDKYSLYRLSWAQKVIRAYANIVQMLTGMNSGQLVSLEFEGAFEVADYRVKKELVEVKFRANGRKVAYAIGGNHGLKVLREYLEFRKWHLGDRECEWLFFCDLGRGGLVDPVPLRSDFQARLYIQLRGKFFPASIKNISPGAARKNKSIVMRQLGIPSAAVAGALNHSEETGRAHYSLPSIDVMESELGNYWDAVMQSVSAINIASPEEEGDYDIVSGHCKDKGIPVVAVDEPSIDPACNKQYGCLYCANYVLHADEEDIRKLLSLKYVVSAVRDMAVEYRRADELFKGLCLRVGGLLERLSVEYPAMEEPIKRIEKEVFDLGILTPFWEARMARYEELGVVL